MTKQVKYKIQQESPIFILGIVTDENDLKICWTINQALNIRLARKENLNDKHSQSIQFAHYSFDDENLSIRYSLLSNKSNLVSYFGEFKNLDYLFIIKGEIDKNKIGTIIQKFRELKIISSSFIIDRDKIKNRERLEII